MPIAFKEWAVTVRALAECEQLITMRKGGIREENKHFELEHDQFFLYPTFDHQRNDLVRESHHPELRRALEEGVWPDDEPTPRALLQDGGIPQPDRVRIRAWAEVTDHWTTDDPRVVDAPLAVPRLDARLRDEAARLEAAPPAPHHAPAGLPHPAPVTVRVRDEYHGCRSWVDIERDLPFEGTPVMADEEFERAAETHPRRGRPVRSRAGLASGPCFRSPAALRRRAVRSCSASAAAATRSARSPSRTGSPSAAVDAVLGGVAWERMVVDPHPGPRALEEIRGGHVLDGAVVVDPAGRRNHARRAFIFASRASRFISGEQTVLIDVKRGPAGAARGIDSACAELGCDLVVLVDIGGDAIADGSEPGLASPLCDAVMLAPAGGARASALACGSSAPDATANSSRLRC